MLKNNPKILQIERIQKTVADFYKMPLKQMTAIGRSQPGSHQRQVAMFLSRTLTGSAYDLIGECFKRDHTTVVHAVESIRIKLASNTALAGEILSLSRTLKPLLAPFPATKPDPWGSLPKPSNYGKGPTVY